MVSIHAIFLVFALSTALLGECPLLCQGPKSVDLTGTVSDAVTQKPLDAADVVLLSSAGKELARVATGSDGKYKVSNLKRGDEVAIYYQRGGYLPRPAGPVSVVLRTGPNVRDLQLMKETDEVAYWLQWAKLAKSSADASTTDRKQRDTLYNEKWSYLGAYGLSPVSQALAARHIAELTPEAAHSRQLMSFASVSIDTLEQAGSNIRAAVDGQAKLSNKYGIPPDVAVAIAASELKKKGYTTPQSEFMTDFGAVWGKEATGDLSLALSHSPPSKNAVTRAWDMDKRRMTADKP